MNIQEAAARLRDNVGKILVGSDNSCDLILMSLLVSGHILLEDVPGTGKTTLAKAIAQSLDLSFKRIQFTPDLMPSDLTGIHFYNQAKGIFEFRPGPLFSQLVLADEINRAAPRTQSSLLEAMEEGDEHNGQKQRCQNDHDAVRNDSVGTAAVSRICCISVSA